MAKKSKESSGDILKDLEAKYGMTRVSPKELTVVSTGSIQLNRAMRIGGTALGKMIEIFGPESSGKSTITLHQMAEYQKAFPERKVALFDWEHCLTGNSLVYIPSIGKNLTCKELNSLHEFDVLSKVNNKIVIQKANIKKLGNRDITKILTQKGIELELTDNHKVLTQNGFKRVDELTLDDSLIKPLNVSFNMITRNNNLNYQDTRLYFLLGYYMGDGLNLGKALSPQFSTDDLVIVNYINSIVSDYGCHIKEAARYAWRITANNNWNYSIDMDELKELFYSGYTIKELKNHFNFSDETIKNKLINSGIVDKNYNFRKHASALRNKKRDIINTITGNKKIKSSNKITEFLRKFEEISIKHDKISLPPNLSNEQFFQFLSGYIMADGSVPNYNRLKKCQVLISSVSRRMLKDIESRLLEHNIRARIEKIEERNSNLPGYRLIISGIKNLTKLNTKINLISYKKERLDTILNSNAKLCKEKERDFEELKIKSIIKNYSNEEVYDISVQNIDFENQNFICENVIVHNSFDPDYAESIGLDVDNILLYQPDTLEQGYDLIIALIEKDLVSCVVIDSQTAATPKATLEGEMGDSTMALQARLNSKFCLKVKGLLAIHNCTLFVISQLRDNIGSMSGESTITTGGKAWKFYSDVRWKIWKINDKDHELNKTTIDVIKSKVGKPFGSAKVNIIWGLGLDKLGEIIDYAIEFGFIKRGGAGWLTVGEYKAQGNEKLKELFMEHPEIYEQLEKDVMNKLNNVEEVEKEIIEEGEELNESN